MHSLPILDQLIRPSNRVSGGRQALSLLRSGTRPRVQGKFLFVRDSKLFLRGVTYGAFRPDEHGDEYHNLEIIQRDFAQMAASGLNVVRIPHTMPPRSLLDVAQQHDLRVMVGLSAEQYVGFLIDRNGAPDIEKLIRAKVRRCANHPSILCYSLGNEIPASIARWLGHRRVERYLEQLYWAVKAEDPEGLVTYVNYPSTEYLRLPFLDFVCFNVYLESQERFEAYLARLHNIAGDRPLVMGEIGLDSLRNGEEAQAHVLDWQVRTTFAAGCAGAFIFSWTDEWYRGDADVEDWAFGLTRRDRSPKPALAAVRQSFADAPFPADEHWPPVSVVVCSYNAAATIRECCEGLLKLEYPDYEVIIVDDGSTDSTSAGMSEYGFRVIRTPKVGLSAARNLGMQAATGEIVAYIDADAYPDPHWLTYLVATLMNSQHVGVGGPNLAPADDGFIAECVDNAPGNPIQVLLTDQEAEHIPGCNMAFRKSCLEAIGGFDPQFRVAGDDVDVCWRLREKGWTLGYSPAAIVWHHRRNSVRAYLRQQIGYSKAEVLLEHKWPEKYNAQGHVGWSGRAYGKGIAQALTLKRERIYQGMWGSAPFQSLYQPAPDGIFSLALMPEWYLIVICLGALSVMSILWSRLVVVIPLFVVALGMLLAQAALGGGRARFPSSAHSRLRRWPMRVLTTMLHLLQPLARLWERQRHGLSPWRQRIHVGTALPLPRTLKIWSERWQAPEQRLTALEQSLSAQRAVVVSGNDFERWDLEVRGGLLGATRLLMATEDHGYGKQLVRVRLWPHWSLEALALIALFTILCIAAAGDQILPASLVLGSIAVALALYSVRECGVAIAVLLRAIHQTQLESLEGVLIP